MVLIGAVAVSCGANLGWLAWGSLQGLGIVAPPALEAVQQEQATAISQLDQNVTGLSAALAGLSARVSSVDAQEADTTRRIGEVDAEIRVLRAGAAKCGRRKVPRRTPGANRSPTSRPRRAERTAISAGCALRSMN